jgi:hypothetical protein
LITDIFLVALGLTVLSLAGVIWSGVTARRSLHYGLVLATLGLLLWAIREARIMGKGLVYEGAAAVFQTIHFSAVAVTFLTLPVLVVTGVRLARKETVRHRKAHRLLAWVFVGSVLVTTALGVAMTLLATQVADPPATGASSTGD